MSDTPRTDAILRDEADSWADTAVRLARLATTLERELAAARAELAAYQRNADGHQDTFMELMHVREERDALRADAERVLTAFALDCSRGNAEGLSKELHAAMDALRERAK